MPSILSKFFSPEWNVPYNCYEMGHGWTPYCSAAALEIGLIVFQQSLKLYAPLYLGQTILQKKFDQKNLMKTTQSILRSSIFLGANAFLVILFLCLSLRISGRFYYPLNAYLPSFFGSLLAILNERPSRRKALAFYVANIASEITYKISISRGYIRPLPNGKYLLFTMAISILLFIYENNLLRDPLICFIFQLVIGNRNSRRQQPQQQQQHEHENDDDDQESIIESNKNLWNKCWWWWWWPKHLGRFWWFTIKNRFPILAFSHPYCSHHLGYSCFENILFQSFLKSFTLGWFSQLGLRFISKLMAGHFHDAFNIFRPNHLISSSRYLSFALFISSFSTVYNSSICMLNHFIHHRSWNCLLSSILASTASFSLFSTPNTSMSLYLVWKSVEALFNVAVMKGYIPCDRLWITIIYAIACSQIFYASILEPSQMKPSYKRFLDSICQNRLQYINRNVLEVFGTNASKGYEYFLPSYDLRFTTRQFQESVLIWLF
ncbi:hypothetical protein DERF_013773 [Dermatophagoides farinae]|uniref:Transmembrane protein 135 N-terminal domain-containing protein n=1 Tax=Dermatophagoides farinae TaxID=6954 RepID=A0A922HMZ4_DERFA|nr:hypothetical protein DERF_013773 [Dermatophagoides farinae]